MKKRREERMPVHLHATFTLDNKRYNGLIQNLSFDGAGSSIVSSVEIRPDFLPSTDLEVDLQLPSGDMIHLRTKIIWFSKDSQNNAVLNVGMQVVEPPPAYRKFIKGLYEDVLEKKTKEQLITELAELRLRNAELEALAEKLRGPEISGEIPQRH